MRRRIQVAKPGNSAARHYPTNLRRQLTELQKLREAVEEAEAAAIADQWNSTNRGAIEQQ